MPSTPDYHLLMTGEEVEALLNKIKNLNLDEIGGIIKIESSQESPANVDSITEKGKYYADYMTGGDTFPDELKQASPVYVTITESTIPGDPDPTNLVVKVAEANGNTYMSWSTDGGSNWSDWVSKPDGATKMPPDLDPDTGKPVSEITEIEGEIENIKDDIQDILDQIGQGGSDLTLGSEAMGDAMLDGTYDYDTGEYPGSTAETGTSGAGE